MKSEILSDLYPDSLTAIFGTKAPQTLFFAGNSSLLNKKKIGLFVSVNCPGTMIFQSYDFVSKMRSRDNISFISGFHSPMEKECLRSLSIGNAGIIWCLAKSIEAFKLPEELELVFSDGKLLLLSSFSEKISRITKQTALERNKLVAAIADEIFFSYAEPGGKTEKLCHDSIEWGKPVFTLQSQENEEIISRGAIPIDVDNVLSYWPKDD